MGRISQWIWCANASGNDIYCDFYDSVSYKGGEVRLRISADSNYAVYINGTLADSGQYADFPHYKIYDELNLTSFFKVGENSIAVTVWHYGVSNMGYYPGKAGLRYEVYVDGELVTCSTENTLSRISRAYENGLCKRITGQLGFSFHYDITAEDGWMTGDLAGFASSVKVDRELNMSPRPIEKLTIGAPAECRVLKAEGGTHFLFDLGREEVGYLTMKLRSDKRQRLLFAYGEHIADGGVRRTVGGRDFSVEVTVGEGENAYTNPFRRLGLRYIELFCESPVEVEQVTVLPTLYPLSRQGRLPADPLDRRIYEVGVRTLELCMHEHYEDCPWREQALYCMDSRNQMLCGYYAFGEYRFPRACLKLMSEDRRSDGLLSICFPTDSTLAIPSFSLHYFTQVLEYTSYSKDVSLIREIYPKLVSVLRAFTDRIDGSGCVLSFVGKQYWNFYEWSDGLSGNLGRSDEGAYEAALNCLLVIALRNMAVIARTLGEKDEYTAFLEPLIKGIRSKFFSEEKGLFYNREGDGRMSELVNALAVLAGVCTHGEASRIAATLADSDSGLTPATLSMLCFKYDALLKVGGETYREYIIGDIRTKYKRMLDAGATSFWETEAGESDFGNAGSLCHGWSAMPVYYYGILGEG
ncbi:MAG: family 78 glycoside hydrolase catalytic domain [Clostridia bacterium]|nr:family 78 glycoside hydrolase catalytic domain [Clostridia bacterium]